MIDYILEILGLVRKSKVEKIIKIYEMDYKNMRDRLSSLEDKNEIIKKENAELKDKNRKLESEYDNYDFRITLTNNKLIKKDNEIKELKLENKYYKNRNCYIALNDNIAFGLSYDLLEGGEEQ